MLSVKKSFGVACLSNNFVDPGCKSSFWPVVAADVIEHVTDEELGQPLEAARRD